MDVVPYVQESLFSTNDLSPNVTNAKPYFPCFPITDITSAQYVRDGTKPNRFMVSYSEVSSYKECKRKHYYGFQRSLAPAIKAGPLLIGDVGHKLLEVYYRNRDKIGRNAAVELVHEQFEVISGENPAYNRDQITGYKGALTAILNDPFLNYEIEEVEKTYYVPLNDEIGLAGTVDLLLSQGKDYTVVDHKFVGRPWSSSAFMISSQLDLYAAMLDYYGYPVINKTYNFVYVQVQQHKTETFALNPNKTKKVIQELMQVAEEIHYKDFLSPEAQDYRAIRVLQPMICRGCAYLDLCYSEMVDDEGRTQKAREVLIPNDYGYRRTDESG